MTANTTKRTEVQTRRLKAAIEMMKDVAKNKREKFDMTCFKRYPYPRPELAYEHKKSSTKFLTQCGTAACFAGWLTESEEYIKAMKNGKIKIGNMVFKYDICKTGRPMLKYGPIELGAWTALAHYFGIDELLAGELMGITGGEPFYGVNTLFEVTPEQVIEKLEAILAGELS